MKNNKKVPFFAQFLENQLTEQEVSGGKGITSKKADVIFVTLKFPSDSDEITDKFSDDIYTKKFPSDSDEITSIKMDKC